MRGLNDLLDEVAVPRAVPVPAPYKVHPVQEIVETPHIHHATVETHSTQAVVTAHATPVHAVAPVAVAGHAAYTAPVGAAYTAGWNTAYAAAPVVAASALTSLLSRLAVHPPDLLT